VSGSAGLGSGRRKLASVVARGEEEGSVGQPWELRAGVILVRGWSYGRRWLRHSTWQPVSESLPVHSGGRATDAVVEQRQSSGESREAEARGGAKRGGETGRGLSMAHV
jgi:hypothetical protein